MSTESTRKTHRSPFRTFSLAAVALLAVALIAGLQGLRSTGARAAAPAINRNVFGIASNGTIDGEASRLMLRDITLAQAVGARWLRVDINWAQIQPANSRSYDWQLSDRVIKAAEKRGLEVLGTLIYTPRWAAASRSCTSPICAPKASAFAAFARAAVARYSKLGVNAYEVWSEENTTAQWLPHPSPAAYTALLKAAYPAIKRADPKSTVITGGTSPSYTTDGDFSPPAFLAAIYHDGAKGYFDAVGSHPYCWPALPGQAETWSAWWETYGAPGSMRDVMVQNGDAGKQIWGTEFGAATYGPPGSYVSPQQQAQTILDGYKLWSTYSWAGPLFVYEGRDQTSYSSKSTEWAYLGLVYNNFAKKPAYYSYERAVQLY